MKRSRLLVVTATAVKIEISAPTSKADALRAFPKTRGECEDGERPCPFASCQYHLSQDVIQDRYGNEKIVATPGWTEAKPSCALDVADDGPKSLAYVSKLMGVNRMRVLQIERLAVVKLRGDRVVSAPVESPTSDEGETCGWGSEDSWLSKGRRKGRKAAP